MVNDDLGAVGKVTELRLPKTQSVWIGLRVTELVAKHSEFRQMRIARNKSTNITLRSYVVYWDVEAIHILIKYVGVPVRERSSLDVLSRDSYIESILNQRRKSESLGSSPVNVLATSNTLESLLKYFLHKSMEIRFFRQSRNSLSYILDSINGDTGVIWILGVLEIGPLIRQPVLRLVLQLLTFDVL